jgi:chorismate mutase
MSGRSPAGPGAPGPEAGAAPTRPRPEGGAAPRRPRPEGGAEALSAGTAAALAPLRARIDAIDHEIVALLNERAELALEIGRVKQATGRRTVRDATREAEVLERVTHASAGLFPEPELVALYRKLIAATRRVQHAQKRTAGTGSAGPAETHGDPAHPPEGEPPEGEPPDPR